MDYCRRHSRNVSEEALPLPSLSSYTDCISPLPYVRLPATVALQLSFSAPVRISDADALRPLTRTASGSGDSVAAAAVSNVSIKIICEIARSRGGTFAPLILNTLKAAPHA